jgi:biofilm PGA synthesis N-glycosyltransferase PgaC
MTENATLPEGTVLPEKGKSADSAIGQALVPSERSVDSVIAEMERFAFQHGELVIAEEVAPARIGCVVPAYNEEETIRPVLKSLLAQSRRPDVIHVVVNNTTDNTFKLAKKFSGRHTRKRQGQEHTTTVVVHDIGKNPDKKVGALNYGFLMVADYDFLLGVDGDTVLAKDTVAELEHEMLGDPRIGGVSAIYSLDNRQRGLVAPLLLTGQRAQFAAFNMQNLLRGRNMAVLGGQCSLFSIPALKDVMAEHHQRAPWVRDSEVEDSLLSLQIKNLGYSTKISPVARAEVGGMTTMRALDGQQVKWNYGAIDLMWPGQRGDTHGQPFHPNMRLRWMENISMLTNIVTRLSFLLLLFASLSIGAFVFSPVWLIPPLVATALNIRTALAMQDHTWRDVLFAVLFIPAEIYLWVRMGHFVRAWAKFLSASRTDNWAAQARAEGGRGWAYLSPLVLVVFAAAAVAWIWTTLPEIVQISLLWVGWPALGVLTAVQTLFMLRRLMRRQHGYKV